MSEGRVGSGSVNCNTLRIDVSFVYLYIRITVYGGVEIYSVLRSYRDLYIHGSHCAHCSTCTYALVAFLTGSFPYASPEPNGVGDARETRGYLPACSLANSDLACRLDFPYERLSSPRSRGGLVPNHFIDLSLAENRIAK